MKKIVTILASIFVCVLCFVHAQAVDVQKGHVFETSRNNLPYQWATIGTEDGYTIIVDNNEYNLQNDTSVYVYIKNNHVMGIEKSELDFLPITKNVKEKYVIEETTWNEIPCTVSYAGKYIVLSAPNDQKWYTKENDWSNNVPDITNTVIVYTDKQTGEMLTKIVWDV